MTIGFAFQIGCGISINNRFNIGLRYLVGTTGYTKTSDVAGYDSTTEDVSMTTSMVQLMVGIML
jgi:hypothetical protein